MRIEPKPVKKNLLVRDEEEVLTRAEFMKKQVAIAAAFITVFFFFIKIVFL